MLNHLSPSPNKRATWAWCMMWYGLAYCVDRFYIFPLTSQQFLFVCESLLFLDGIGQTFFSNILLIHTFDHELKWKIKQLGMAWLLWFVEILTPFFSSSSGPHKHPPISWVGPTMGPIGETLKVVPPDHVVRVDINLYEFMIIWSYFAIVLIVTIGTSNK